MDTNKEQPNVLLYLQLYFINRLFLLVMLFVIIQNILIIIIHASKFTMREFNIVVVAIIIFHISDIISNNYGQLQKQNKKIKLDLVKQTNNNHLYTTTTHQNVITCRRIYSTNQVSLPQRRIKILYLVKNSYTMHQNFGYKFKRQNDKFQNAIINLFFALQTLQYHHIKFYMATSRNLYLFVLIFIAFAFLAVELEQSSMILKKIHNLTSRLTCNPSCAKGQTCRCNTCASPCKKGVACIQVCVTRCTCS